MLGKPEEEAGNQDALNNSSRQSFPITPHSSGQTAPGRNSQPIS
jgi:hypothetical protein